MADLLHLTRKLIIFSFLIAVSVPPAASTDCASHAKAEKTNKSEALKFKLVAIASVLAAGAAGVTFPILGRKLAVLRPDNDIFFLIKSFAGGVILATGFVHVLPDAFRTLTSPCLGQNPWSKFPFAGFVAMVASIATLMIDTTATAFYKNMHSNKCADEEVAAPAGGGHSHATNAHTPIMVSDLIRHRIISQVLELGIVVHSLIIGLSLGASQSVDTIKPLLIALSFHQFFEGMGLGGCISQARFESLTTTIMTIFFSGTAPVGIGIGIAMSSVYKRNTPRAAVVEGVLDAASAGILIYMALVDLLAADFMSRRMEKNARLQMGAYVSVLLGTGSMSFLAMWA